MKGQKWYLLSRMEPNGDTVCVHPYADAGEAEQTCADLPDVSALRDHGEAAYVVNVVTQTEHGVECPITPGETYAMWQAPPTWILFKGHAKLEAARANNQVIL